MGPVRLIGRRCGRFVMALLLAAVAVAITSGPGHAQTVEPVPDIRIAPPGAAPGDVLGAALAASGDLLAVGLRGSDASGTNAGAVMLFRRTGHVFESSGIVVPGLVPGDEFGTCVALSNDWVLGGAPRRGVSGAAFVAPINGDLLTATELRDAAAVPGAAVGASLAVGKGWVAVGAPNDASGNVASSGSIRIHRRSGTSWEAGERLALDLPVAAARFGSALAADGDWLAVGAPGLDGGRVFLYRVTLREVVLVQVLSPMGIGAASWFGASVAIGAGRVVVGAPYSDLAAVDAGAAIEFVLHPAGAVMMRTLIPSLPCEGGNFGHSVAAGTDATIVGAPGALSDGQRVGCADVFVPGTDGALARLVPDDDAASLLAGTDVAVMGALAMVGVPGSSAGRGEVIALDLVRDCDRNGLPDAVDVASGRAVDADLDGVPDSCECPTDLDASGTTDGADLGLLLGAWGRSEGDRADLDFDGFVSGADLGLLLGAWGACLAP
jgi:hypothetical protein